MTAIEIDVVFDFVCAWCYIAKRQLEQAISLYRKTYPGGKLDDFVFNYRPYYLNYGPSTHSVDKSEVADVKLANMTPEQRTRLYRRMDQIGKAVGITFRSGGKVGDTRHAHRLVRLSQTIGPEIQNSLVDGIFAAYHEQEKDIADKTVLKQVAVAAGLDVAVVDEWLNKDTEASIVDKEAAMNKEIFVGSGVPAYIIGSQRIDGAQDAQDFFQAFIDVKEGKPQV